MLLQPLNTASRAKIRLAFLPRLAGIVVSTAVTLLGLVVLTFVLARLLPADPVYAVLGDYATPAEYQAMYVQLGLDRPLWEQLARYVGNILIGDFGQSVVTNNNVVADILSVFPATVELAVLSLILAVAIGVPLGVIAAAYRNSAVDFIARLFGLVGYSAPSFWLALVALMVFYGALGWLPGPGRIGVVYSMTFTSPSGFFLVDSALQGRWDVFSDVAARLILPATILAYASAAYIMRMTRSFMIAQLAQEYVILAAAKGMSYANIVWVQAFRAIAVQLTTIITLVFAGLLEGSVLIEVVFAFSGFGSYMIRSMLVSDMNAVIGSVFFVGLMTIILNLIADALYRALDPRSR